MSFFTIGRIVYTKEKKFFLKEIIDQSKGYRVSDDVKIGDILLSVYHTLSGEKVIRAMAMVSGLELENNNDWSLYNILKIDLDVFWVAECEIRFSQRKIENSTDKELSRENDPRLIAAALNLLLEMSGKQTLRKREMK